MKEKLFEVMKEFRTEYNRIKETHEQRIDALNGIHHKCAKVCAQVADEEFETATSELRRVASIRKQNLVNQIQDAEAKKRIRYCCNHYLRNPDKCKEYETADEFFDWCGVDGDELGPP